jgi:hypothetical protein
MGTDLTASCEFPNPIQKTTNKKNQANRFILASLRRYLAAYQSFDFVWDSTSEIIRPQSPQFAQPHPHSAPFLHLVPGPGKD